MDALDRLSAAWGRLPPARRAAWDGRWRERMHVLEGIPKRLFGSKPTLLQRAHYMRLADRAEELRPLIEGLGLRSPRLP